VEILIRPSGFAASVERVNRIELVPERRENGTVVLRAVVVGPLALLSRLVARA
jgi:hypothetical protein